MNAQELADRINGREYRNEMTHFEESEAKAAGLVVVFGASDDLMEFRGAISDEVGCYDGGKAIVDRIGVVPDFEDIDRDDKEELREYFKREDRGATIAAAWGVDDYSWVISTDLPHVTFRIEDDGEQYCRGIVFSINDLPA